MKAIKFFVFLIFFLMNIISCAAMEKIDKSMTQKVLDDKEKREQVWKNKVSWMQKYLFDVLYLNMRESEFVEHFTRISPWVDSERPYITKHVGSRYTVSGLESSYDYRMTFEDGVLIKLEYHGHGGGGNPFGYNDATASLK